MAAPLTSGYNYSNNTIANWVYDAPERAIRVTTISPVTSPVESSGLATFNVTGTGGTITLNPVPVDDSTVIVFINDDIAVDALPGSGMTSSGGTLTFDNATLGMVLTAGDKFYVKYESAAGTYTHIVESPTLTPTATGATFNISSPALDSKAVLVYIDGKVVDALPGSALYMTENSGVLDNALLGLPITGTERFVVEYYTDPSAVDTVKVIEANKPTITATGATFVTQGLPYGTVIAYLNGDPINSEAGTGLVMDGQKGTFDNALLGKVVAINDRLILEYQKRV